MRNKLKHDLVIEMNNNGSSLIEIASAVKNVFNEPVLDSRV